MQATINNQDYKISMPLNSWDVNFHVIDINGVDHLVDLQDVIDWKYQDDETVDDVGASIDDLINMIDEIGIEMASWKSI